MDKSSQIRSNSPCKTHEFAALCQIRKCCESRDRRETFTALTIIASPGVFVSLY